jgi:hypothetical protein
MTNQEKTTLIKSTNTDTHHERNPANPRTGAKPSYKKKMKSNHIGKDQKGLKLGE